MQNLAGADLYGFGRTVAMGYPASQISCITDKLQREVEFLRSAAEGRAFLHIMRMVYISPISVLYCLYTISGLLFGLVFPYAPFREIGRPSGYYANYPAPFCERIALDSV